MLAANRRFEHLVMQSNSSKAVLMFNKNPVTEVGALTGIIMNHPDKERLQDLFEKAIMVNNNIAAEKLGIVSLAHLLIIQYNYELDLKTLMEKSYPEKLRPNMTGSCADLFLMRDHIDEGAGNYENALEKLRTMGAMKRHYESPIQTYSWTLTEIKSLIYQWFNKYIKNAQAANVRLFFNSHLISDHMDLAIRMTEQPRSDEGRAMPDDGRMFLFFKKVLDIVTSMPRTAHERSLDLGQLTPNKLKEKNIKVKEIEDILDGNGGYKENNAVILFLRMKGALLI
jgi:hypothetical protein